MFDSTKFANQQFIPRIQRVEVPRLKNFFDDGEDALWELRGQTASEIAVGNEAFKTQTNITKVIEAMAKSSVQVAEVKRALGISEDTPEDIVKRLSMLVSCSISPQIDLPIAVKLAETFPIVFYTLTHTIIKLTTLGMDVKKPSTSGSNQK